MSTGGHLMDLMHHTHGVEGWGSSYTLSLVVLHASEIAAVYHYKLVVNCTSISEY